MKKIFYLFTFLVITGGLQAQVSKAGVYTIGSADNMYGIAINAGSVVFNSADSRTYMLTEDVEATQTLNTTAGKILLGPGTESQMGSSSFNANYADVTSFGAAGDGETDDTEAINLALQETGVIFFPGSAGGKTYMVAGIIRMPANKILKFGHGAKLDVPGTLIGTGTEIDAGAEQIFAMNSNLTGTWTCKTAYPEWFGAVADGYSDCAPAIQKTIDVFKHDVKFTGTNYKVYGTIHIGAGNSLYIDATTLLTPAAQSNDDLFFITGEPFIIEGGRIKVERGYNKWIFNVSIDRQGDNDFTPRLTSVIRDVIVEGYMYGEHDFSGMAYNGIKLKSAKKGDYSYFSLMDNVDFYRPDTAIYLTGHDESGMNNSWHWNNITIDWSMRGIILDKRAAGHVFTNLIIQPNTRKKTTLIEVASKYNSFQGVIWDIFSPNTIVLKYGAENNYFSHMGRVDMYERFVDDRSGYKSLNVFSTSNPFEPTKNHYSVYTDEVVGIGIRDNRSSNIPQFTVKNQNSFAGAFIRKTTIQGSSDYLSSAGTVPGLVLSAQTSGNMVDGFGGGLLFIMKDKQTDSTEYGQNIAARILARREGTDNRGLLQFFTKGTNASSPALTLRNNGFVGIGTADPEYLLDIKGNFRATGTVKIEDVLQLKPRLSPPTNPVEGQLYINSANHHIYCYLNGTWKQLD